ncbi:hypothetical protein IH824_17730 [candidate division KSB1 bacterium]|nr:hypothetical protein [candidate division KSB1 bacterium]
MPSICTPYLRQEGFKHRSRVDELAEITMERSQEGDLPEILILDFRYHTLC